MKHHDTDKRTDTIDEREALAQAGTIYRAPNRNAPPPPTEPQVPEVHGEGKESARAKTEADADKAKPKK